MIPFASYLITAAVSATLAVSAALYVQGNRHKVEILEIQNKAAETKLASADRVIKDMADFQKGFNDALDSLTETQAKNRESQRNLDTLLRDLRGTTAGLRGDFAHLPDRIAAAAQPALAEYATTCTTVFTGMAERGQRMAERGARIAEKADGHAADAKFLYESRPRKPE